jgi:hypothetical protein
MWVMVFAAVNLIGSALIIHQTGSQGIGFLHSAIDSFLYHGRLDGRPHNPLSSI